MRSKSAMCLFEVIDEIENNNVDEDINEDEFNIENFSINTNNLKNLAINHK